MWQLVFIPLPILIFLQSTKKYRQKKTLRMYGHNHNEPFYEYPSLELINDQFSLPDTTSGMTTFPPPPLYIPDPLSALRSEIGYTSSACSSYGGSPSSINATTPHSPTTLMQRSYSFTKNMESYSPMNSSIQGGFFDLESSSVRKALSTGDLQGVNLGQHSRRSNSPLANETSILESMSRATPYSPEEKKERIERYRSKKNLRNFNKKIKYECRKTLADSRPRIRGRFARNDEIEKTPQSQWDIPGAEEDYEEDENWVHFLDSFSANLMP